MIKPIKILRTSLPTLFEKAPPASPEAEINVIGGLIQRPQHINEISEVLDAEDFESLAIQNIYRVMIRLHETGQPLEPNAILTLVRAENPMDAEKRVDSAGDLLEKCVQSSMAAETVYYAKKVKETAERRRAIVTLWEGLHGLYTTDAATPIITDSTVSELMAIAGEKAVKILTIAELLGPAYDEINDRAAADEDTPMGLSTGLPDLDNILSGLENGTLTIVAARTSVGKTAMTQQWAEHIAAGQAAVGCVSLEMSEKQLAYRLLAARSRVGNHLLRRPKRMNGNDWMALNAAMEALESIRLFTAIAPGCELGKLVSISRRMYSRGVRCLIIDHLGLMQAPQRQGSNRNESLGEITSGIKRLALEMNIPVVLLCQLNRIAATEKPAIHHLRESGRIEEDADNVVLLHRPEMRENDEKGLRDSEPAKALIVKNRNGPLAEVDLHYFPAQVRFGCPIRAPFAGAFGNPQP